MLWVINFSKYVDDLKINLSVYGYLNFYLCLWIFKLSFDFNVFLWVLFYHLC